MNEWNLEMANRLEDARIEQIRALAFPELELQCRALRAMAVSQTKGPVGKCVGTRIILFPPKN